jgi:hypothetical protein
MIDAQLRESDLSGVNLREADLRGVDLKDARLIGAHLGGADLSGAHNLVQEQLNEACGNDATKVPEGLRIPSCGDGTRTLDPLKFYGQDGGHRTTTP